MITTLQLKFGRTPGAWPEPVELTPITVFVGPNNSGKSRILGEIGNFCTTGHTQATHLILDRLMFESLEDDDAMKQVEKSRKNIRPSDAVPVGSGIFGGKHGRAQVTIEQFLGVVKNPASNPAGFCQWFLRDFVLMLDGRSRIGLTDMQSAGDFQSPPDSSFQALAQDDAKRAEVRRIVFDAFEEQLVVDPTNLGQLRLRLSKVAPSSSIEEIGIHPGARLFHAAATPIENSSDGVKAFTGIISEVVAGDPRVVLIDEPEAFLHPALAAKLGRELALASVDTKKRVFVSTHSPSFVMGCIQSRVPVNIIRLTYRNEVPTARLLPSNELLLLMRNPLLRTTNVLNGLFYEFVVVTESDADRAFYQEINERMLEMSPPAGIPNCLFLNAQNKQTERTIVAPLRKLGIPTAFVVDIDVVKDGGQEFTSLLCSANVPEPLHDAFASMRGAVKSAFLATGRNMKIDGGIALLQGAEKESALGLFSQLAEYGVFVVPGGEVESWLSCLKVGGHGPPWLVAMFERMGENPSLPDYIRPADGDVWKFIGCIRKWLMDGNRKGIPG